MASDHKDSNSSPGGRECRRGKSRRCRGNWNSNPSEDVEGNREDSASCMATLCVLEYLLLISSKFENNILTLKLSVLTLLPFIKIYFARKEATFR